MDAKKFQQLQLAQAQAQKKLPLAYQANINDYCSASQSPVFAQHQNFIGGGLYPQSPTNTSSSSGGPLSPIDMQPQPNKSMLKHNLGTNSNLSSAHSSPFHQGYNNGEQLYQSTNERAYLAAAGRLQSSNNNHHSSAFQQQYQQLQQAKLKAQMQTQNEAMQQQQRTFALRQALNPPVNPGSLSQSSSIMSSMTLQQQQANPQQQSGFHQQRAPPSSLNLSNQFQPAVGPLKVNQKNSQQQYEQQLYAQQQQQLQIQLQHQKHLHQQQQQQKQQQQQQQMQLHAQQHQLQIQTPNEQSPIYIQQNHPGHVVNQACQTQISAVKASNNQLPNKGTPSSEESSSKSPVHVALDRKKSVGSAQALKSPVSKRPPGSPVTLSGWLYKQGSDGLKVWRKRWFVLSEYILYYYKGPEEEKLLGSILLPSYKVSACSPEDKIYRKFAFKCEHQNMRTYWLAAETGESMVQWVRSLTAATMMQAPTSSSGDSDHNSQPSMTSSSLNNSGENSDSGIHTLQSHQSKLSLQQGQGTPASENSAPSTNGPNAALISGGQQPLYANAPPKPKRINDGGYSSPSPEHSIDNERKHHGQAQSQQQSARQLQQHHAIYDTRTGSVSTSLHLQRAQQQFCVDNLESQFQQQMSVSGGPTSASIEEEIRRLQKQHQQHQQQLQQRAEDIYGERELYMQKLMQQRLPSQMGSAFNNTERRTPDAYGRSKNRIFSDYEDIYNMTQGSANVNGGMSAQEALLQEAASYRRPLSPPSYDAGKHIPTMPSRYTPNHLEATTSPTSALAGNVINLRARPAAAIMRPHSADFLEYEARAEAAAAVLNANNSILPSAATAAAATTGEMKAAALRAARPKSSLDINRTPDSFYYSEASYAEKMRKSALYLQNPHNAHGHAQPQLAGGYRTAADFLSPMGSGLNTIGYENPYERSQKHNELMNEAFTGQGGAASIPRMSRLASSASSAHIRSTSTNPPLTPSHLDQEENDITPPHFSPTASTAEIIQQNEQFLRSASARLPKRNSGLDDDYGSSSGNNCSSAVTSPPTARASPNAMQDGERKREESMKRLLEWKQRMLQSPLTRKGVQHTNNGSNMTAMSKLGSNPNILLSSTTVASGAQYPSKLAKHNSSVAGGGSSIQRSRSETHANAGPAGYNSYSSDDEASISVRNVRNLPKSNLTVKPDPSDRQNNEDTTGLFDSKMEHKNKLTNSYYGTAQDTKYAKTTSLLTDRRNSRNLTNPFVEMTTDSYNNYNGYGNSLMGGHLNGNIMTTSTPLHASNMADDYYAGNSLANLHTESLFDELQHHQYQQLQQQQQLQMMYNGGGYATYQTEVPYSMRRVGSRAEIDMLERDTSSQLRNLNVSAGDLLSRTHEELVLLLIQLRRQNSNTARAIEQCCSDIHDVQNRLRTAEGLTRAESIQRLDYLKQHLLDLERHYEKSKPLVNLVDNMVKLGSLYRNNDGIASRRPSLTRNDGSTLERLEYNQLIEERRLMQEEQQQWERLNTDQSELESKVQQLYIFDQLLQEESTTLQNLQKDKEDLEKALGGIKARIHESNDTPMALEAAKKQQFLLERELSRVHQLLADNSKKLEQTVAGNSRLEQELLILRQKLQIPKTTLAQGISETYASNATAMLESELKRVQDLVGDMQRQRQELSDAVRQLTENSTKLYQEIGKKDFSAGIGNGSMKKRSNSTSWTETDLDSMQSLNHTISDSTLNLSTPLYVDTSSSNNGHLSKASNDNYHNHQHNYGYNDSSDQFETSDDGFLDNNPFANLSNQEKQEIKTVRIVKRESERRNRDRSERTGLSSSQLNLDQVLEEELLSNGHNSYVQHHNGYNVPGSNTTTTRSQSLPRSYNDPPLKSRQQTNKTIGNGSLKVNGSSYYNGLVNGRSKEAYQQNGSHYDRNSKPTSQSQNGVQTKEHLNPLANAYFAKQLQQQQQQQHQNGYARNSLRLKTDSVQSLNKSITDLSNGQVFQSEAARQIVNEISGGSASEDTEKIIEKVPSQHKHRRAVPREKRRHYTAPNNVNVKAMESVQAENDMNRNNTNWRARDDLDMDLALRPRLNAPDVVRSALGQGEKISENTIDNLLLAPNKIVIPERYIPETTPELSPEEKKRRQEKVESIKKMLAETPISTTSDQVTVPTNKINAEKKQREHLLQLNQILAQQVMQMSKIVAEKAMSNNKKPQNNDEDGKSESPSSEAVSLAGQ